MKHSWFHLFLLVLAPAGLGAAEIKQWADQDGRVHFGDQAPAGVSAETKRLDETPQIGAQERWKPRPGEREMLQRHEDRGRELKESKARSVEQYERSKESQADAGKRKARCYYYRNRLEYYQAKSRQGYTRKEQESIDRNLASYGMKVKTYCE